MSKPILEQLATIPKLREVWGEFWRRAGKKQSSGADGVTAQKFNSNLDYNLQILRSQLRHGYKFDPLIGHPVPKPNSKKDRIICVPTVRDRVVQRLVGRYLSDNGKRYGIENDASYGFLRTKGGRPRGVGPARDRAIKLRCEHQWAYKSDITAFFDQIRRADLLEIVDRTIRTPSVYPLLEEAVNCEIDTRSPSLRRRVKNAGITFGQGVRQGMPLSPFFANLILKDFDRCFISRGIPLIRYADDFIAFADDEQGCKKIDELARYVLGEMGFEIPEIGDIAGKTRICNPNEGIEFLGLALSPAKKGEYELQITKSQLDKISEDLYRYKDLEFLREEKLNLMNVSGVLEKKIGGYRSAYPSRIIANSDELYSILDHAVVEVFAKLFTKLFGPDAVRKLNRRGREFLCLTETITN